MRDYNFRKKAVIKEQKKRKWLWNEFCWPSMPNKKTDENGKQYFIEGKTGAYKKFLKKQANKAVRQSKLDIVGSGANYKRVYDLTYKWY